jgi:hypothetical protein
MSRLGIAAVALAAALLPGALLPDAAWGLDGQLMLDALPTAALVQQGPSAPWMQSETTVLAAQGVLSQTVPLAGGLSISGTIWGLADSLPSGSPLSPPPAKLDLESRVLELRLGWEAIPGTFIVDVGKLLIHPSSGFFRTPLNVITHGALAGTANLTGSAVGAWEEGWIGAGATLLAGGFTVSNFFSPRLDWPDATDAVMAHISSRQPDFQDLSRVTLRVGVTDLQALGLISTGGPGSADPDFHFTAGAGMDTSIGDAITVRAEVAVSDSTARVAPASTQLPLSVVSQSVPWAPRALAGLTWTGANQLTVMAEYYYNGAGFAGNDYRQLISYSQALRGAPGAGPDLLDQFGSFSAGQHYGFVRIAGPIDATLSAAGWTTVNLQDLSGLSCAVLTATFDKWTLNASFLDAWGTTDTEAGLSPLLWRVDLEVSLFL